MGTHLLDQSACMHGCVVKSAHAVCFHSTLCNRTDVLQGRWSGNLEVNYFFKIISLMDLTSSLLPSSWGVFLRIYICTSLLTIFQSYRDLETGDIQSLKFKWRDRESNPGIFSPLARNTFAPPPPRGNFADLVFLKEHDIRNILSHVCTLAVGAFRIFGVKREKLCKNHWK